MMLPGIQPAAASWFRVFSIQEGWARKAWLAGRMLVRRTLGKWVKVWGFRCRCWELGMALDEDDGGVEGAKWFWRLGYRGAVAVAEVAVDEDWFVGSACGCWWSACIVNDRGKVAFARECMLLFCAKDGPNVCELR